MERGSLERRAQQEIAEGGSSCSKELSSLLTLRISVNDHIKSNHDL